MPTELLKERFHEIEKLALAAGLHPYDVHFFEVPAPVIWQTASYGLPTRYSHWSFGKVYQYQKTQAEMGFSKIYELIINNDPSLAFLDKSNTDTINLMIAAHCFGHSDFFRNNILFQKINETKMIDVAKRHAVILDQFRNDYGDDEVDEWLDVALALEQHIDIFKGYHRSRYPVRQVVYKDRKVEPYEDLLPKIKQEPLIKREIEGIHIPPKPEKDILWFLTEYGNLEPWQQKILEIVRRESYYFYPQFRTKIMNEGWASYWHAELMNQYALGNENDLGVKDLRYPLTSEEHMDFAAAHEKVVQPGLKVHLKEEVEEVDDVGRPTGKKQKVWSRQIQANPGIFGRATRVNPYYLGFRMFRDIKERWDKYYKDGYREDEWGEKVSVTIDGNQKIREVMTEEDDVSFLRNYLTENLAAELHLFSYGNISDYRDDYETQEKIRERMKQAGTRDLGKQGIDGQLVANKTIAVHSKKMTDLINTFSKTRNNYGVPAIVVRRVDEAGLLRLEHTSDDSVNLDIDYAEHVLKYVYRIWRRPVELVRKPGSVADKTWLMSYNGISFEIDHQTPDYPECVEDTDIPSSW